MTSDNHDNAGPFYEKEVESSTGEVEIQAPKERELQLGKLRLKAAAHLVQDRG